MQQLSSLDASFYFLETEHTPMHVGGLYLFDNSQFDEDFTFAQFRSHILSRLHIARFFRQRIIEVPLKLDNPYWVDDPDFHVDNHLLHVPLGKPSNRKKLLNMAAAEFAKPLERDKPLWEALFVDGLDEHEFGEHRFAVIFKLHHCAIDSISGEEMISALLDVEPNKSRSEIAREWKPEELPSEADLLLKAYKKKTNQVIQLGQIARELLSNLTNSMLKRRLIESSSSGDRSGFFSAPHTSFNGSISCRRVFGHKALDMARIKAVRDQVQGATVNDVILTICAGAMRHYLNFKRNLPRKSLIAFSPLSVRSRSVHSSFGNQMSATLVRLGTDIEDPVERLLSIHKSVTSSKVYNHAISADSLTEIIPTTTLALAARLYSGLHLADRHSPIYNLSITNVPGPQRTLYLSSARLEAQSNSAPLFDGLGLVMVALSYNGVVDIAVTSTPEVMPDMQVMTDAIGIALNDLEVAVERSGVCSIESDLPMKNSELPMVLTKSIWDEVLEKAKGVVGLNDS
ncbi:wax ester/triacylglycerol synthase family O-acyltransferase [Litoribacillus peritrichatus]|uniref:diacylglycerol O-acyltransferase n=1 Tax=Litoribacillus peritrichatus TaxID=718191 RepID=A0ABP7MQ65_9GAMM